MTYAEVAEKINKSDSLEVLELAGEFIQLVPSIEQRDELAKLYRDRLADFKDSSA